MLVNAPKDAKRLSWEMSDRAVTKGFAVSVGIGMSVSVEVGGIDVGEGGTEVRVGATPIVVAVGDTSVAAGPALSQPASRVRTIIAAAITLSQVDTVFSLHFLCL
jgi:hypothetical protein